jgi:hypothetical protein
MDTPKIYLSKSTHEGKTMFRVIEQGIPCMADTPYYQEALSFLQKKLEKSRGVKILWDGDNGEFSVI